MKPCAARLGIAAITDEEGCNSHESKKGGHSTGKQKVTVSGLILAAVLAVGIPLWLCLPVVAETQVGRFNASREGCSENSSAAVLSYNAPRYFPFPPFRVVLETKPGACDLAAPSFINSRDPHDWCKAFEVGDLQQPEPFIAQTIASFLAHCLHTTTPCRAIDIGANLGIPAAFMAALGAKVEAVEPSMQMATAIAQTARANCWDGEDGRLVVHHGGITAKGGENGKSVQFRGGWRLADPKRLKPQPEEIVLVAIQNLMKRGGHVDLLKIDVDNSKIETELLTTLTQMILKGEVSVTTVVMEFAWTSDAWPRAEALEQLQSNGYHAYRLPHHLHQMDNLEEWYTPCVGVRAFKYVLHIHELLPAVQWLKLLTQERDKSNLGKPVNGLSLVLSRQRIGVGVDAKWTSWSMRNSLPATWRAATCGGDINKEAQEWPHM